MDITKVFALMVIVAWKSWTNPSILYLHFQVLSACLGLSDKDLVKVMEYIGKRAVGLMYRYTLDVANNTIFLWSDTIEKFKIIYKQRKTFFNRFD